MDAKDNEGFTAVHLAVVNHHYPVLQLLAEAGADTSIQTTDGKLPLHSAATVGFTKGIPYLCKLRPDLLNSQNKGGNTALHIAAVSGHSGCVAALLGLGADIQITNNASFTPYHLAMQSGHTEMASLIRNYRPGQQMSNDDLNAAAEGLTKSGEANPLEKARDQLTPPPPLPRDYC